MQSPGENGVTADCAWLQFCKIALYVLSSVFLYKHGHILSQSHFKRKTKPQGQILPDSLFLVVFLSGLWTHTTPRPPYMLLSVQNWLCLQTLLKCVRAPVNRDVTTDSRWVWEARHREYPASIASSTGLWPLAVSAIVYIATNTARMATHAYGWKGDSFKPVFLDNAVNVVVFAFRGPFCFISTWAGHAYRHIWLYADVHGHRTNWLLIQNMMFTSAYLD